MMVENHGHFRLAFFSIIWQVATEDATHADIVLNISKFYNKYSSVQMAVK